MRNVVRHHHAQHRLVRQPLRRRIRLLRVGGQRVPARRRSVPVSRLRRYDSGRIIVLDGRVVFNNDWRRVGHLLRQGTTVAASVPAAVPAATLATAASATVSTTALATAASATVSTTALSTALASAVSAAA